MMMGLDLIAKQIKKKNWIFLIFLVSNEFWSNDFKLEVNILYPIGKCQVDRNKIKKICFFYVNLINLDIKKN